VRVRYFYEGAGKPEYLPEYLGNYKRTKILPELTFTLTHTMPL
jgi:hypothetical protein